jgi:hypothetical protein
VEDNVGLGVESASVGGTPTSFVVGSEDEAEGTGVVNTDSGLGVPSREDWEESPVAQLTAQTDTPKTSMTAPTLENELTRPFATVIFEQAYFVKPASAW